MLQNKPSCFVTSVRLIEDGDDSYDIIATTLVPNSTLSAGKAEIQKPADIDISDPSIIHVKLGLRTSGKVARLSEFTARPVYWTLNDVNIPKDIRAIMLHVTLKDKTLSTQVVDVSSDRLGQITIDEVQKLTDLRRLVESVGLDSDVILKKLKDVGY